MKIIEAVKGPWVNLCRFLLALTFIFSGFVKAIDPLGTQYKIGDYLAAVRMEGLVADWIQLLLSISLSAFEFSLGVLMLLAIRRRLTSKLTLVFMVLMTIVTLWLTIWEPIKDCGCFGDAIHLTNRDTFIKNVVLLAAAIVVWKWPLYQQRFVSKTNQWIAINFTVVFILVASLLSLYHLPIFDFRPYYIGQNIPKAMEIPKGAKQPKFQTTFIMEKDGQRKEFTLEEYPSDTTWHFIDSKTVQTEKGYEPPVHDFSISDPKTGHDLTQQILHRKGYTFLLVTPYLEHADDSDFGDIDRISEYAQEHGYGFYGLTSSNDKAIAHWRNITGAEYPFYTADGITLKTVIRSNPGLVLLYEGTIIRKWSHNDLPTAEELSVPLEQAEVGHMPEDHTWENILAIILCYILPLVVLIVADRLWSWSKWVKKREEWMRQKEEANRQWLIRKEKEQSNKLYQLLKRKDNEKENRSR